ncbi:MAG: phosphoribosylformylglycinamidine cyclo-ligase, partial [Gloeomargaritaceae cyanobacterium C42_A2020_066]|nr:phosphoribosylformylglycinamidine cyclo-ligase [Gloeomargaritaceae cyanobacterium C42_A2020_066]
ETAEMPGFYGPGEYDLAGFCVGAVERSALLAGSQVQLGDVALGLASQGVHSNGYSLVRRIVADGNWDWGAQPAALGGVTLAEALLTPTQIYVPAVTALRQAGVTIHGMAHITGGGLPENLPRCLGSQQTVVIDWEAWPVPPIFQWLAAAGRVEADEMRQTFNMGIGFVVILPAADLPAAQACLEALPLASYPLGTVTVSSPVDGL